MWETLFPVSALLFSICKLCLRYTAGNCNENPSMRALAKIWRVRASEHSCNFCEQFEQRPNFASTFKLDGTIRYPSYWNLMFWATLRTSSIPARGSRNTPVALCHRNRVRGKCHMMSLLTRMQTSCTFI